MRSSSIAPIEFTPASVNAAVTADIVAGIRKSSFQGGANPLVRMAVEAVESRFKSWPESARFAKLLACVSRWSVNSAKSALFDVAFGTSNGYSHLERIAAGKIMVELEA